jgi:hypothetical protein
VATDPRFVDAPNGDYHLAPGSPGIDTGTNDPPEGLGPRDVEGRRRVMGSAVDIGAHESIGDVPPGPGGGPDEPSCRLLWPGVDRTTHACRCALDFSLPNFNCAFLGPEIFLDLRVPWPPVPATPTKLDWTLHPWASVAGPYDLEMAARLDGKWTPLKRLGTGAPGLEEGKLVVEPFALELDAKRRILLRTRFSYLPSGAKDPIVAELDVLLPKPTKLKE